MPIKSIIDLIKPLTREEAYNYYKKKEEKLKQKSPVLKTGNEATKDERQKK